MNDKDIKTLVNKVFAQKGMAKIKTNEFAQQFSSGSKYHLFYLTIFSLVLFEALFNILYEERINCHLVNSAITEDRLLNWNRINASICFNYLQQQFYLVKPTMKTLSVGKNDSAILKLLRVLFNTAQGAIGDAKYLEDEALKEIADVMEY